MSLSTSTGCSGVASAFFAGRDEIELHFARLSHPHAVRNDFGVEPKASILVSQPFRHLMARFRAGPVRLAREMAQIALRVCGVGILCSFDSSSRSGFTRSGKKPRMSPLAALSEANDSISGIARRQLHHISAPNDSSSPLTQPMSLS